MSKSVKVYAPATVSNVGSGFDILGFAIYNPGDEMIVRLNSKKRIEIINESQIDLPTKPEKNVSGVSLQAMLDDLKSDQGFDLIFSKKILSGSGIGSSSASSAASVFGANELLGKPYTKMELVSFAMEGERLASGSVHADNVAPCILGGFVLIRSYNPLDIIQVESPEGLYCIVVHPEIEIKTEHSRKILKQEVKLQDAITQWGNVAGLIAGLMKPDFKLIGNSLEDVIAEPVRSVLIPEFDRIKKKVKEDGALGCSISGSGPSIFALSDSEEIAKKIAISFKSIFDSIDIPAKTYISLVNKEGCKVLK